MIRALFVLEADSCQKPKRKALLASYLLLVKCYWDTWARSFSVCKDIIFVGAVIFLVGRVAHEIYDLARS